MYYLLYIGGIKERPIMYFDGSYVLSSMDSIKKGSHLSTKEHPFLFPTAKSAERFIRKMRESEDNRLFSKYNVLVCNSEITIPKCRRECHVCNKKHKEKCKHLLNPMQNHCGFRMAEFEKTVEIDPKRLDASCEKCLTKDCPYNMNM